MRFGNAEAGLNSDDELSNLQNLVVDSSRQVKCSDDDDDDDDDECVLLLLLLLLLSLLSLSRHHHHLSIITILC